MNFDVSPAWIEINLIVSGFFAMLLNLVLKTACTRPSSSPQSFFFKLF